MAVRKKSAAKKAPAPRATPRASQPVPTAPPEYAVAAAISATQTLIDPRITSLLKANREQREVVGPLVGFLAELGWDLGQMQFGRREWRVPRVPSEATKRERGDSFDGVPCDIAIFDSANRFGDPQHLIIVIETKTPEEEAGISQLEQYMAGEPHVKLGVWANTADPSAPAVFLFRQPNGSLVVRRRPFTEMPRPGEKISAKQQRLDFADLTVPSEETLRRTIEELLDRVVVDDPNVTRREDQLDQLCGVLLLKLHSDKRAKLNVATPPFFRPLESEARTAEEIRREFGKFVRVYPDTFTTSKDQQLLLSDSTIYQCVERLAPYRLIDVGVETMALGFQVLRTSSAKAGRGAILYAPAGY